MGPLPHYTHIRTTMLLLIGWLVCAASVIRADEQQILTRIQEFFATENLDRRVEIARQIEADPAYQRAKVSNWLHQAINFEARSAGMQDVTIALYDGRRRRVALRIPPTYNPAKPWPLIYALHGLNSSGEDIIHYCEYVLGTTADEYIIAAPSGYEEILIGAEWPLKMEHSAILTALKRQIHVDSDRIYAMGYSQGGHTAWTLAVLYADLFAGVVPIAGSFILPESDRLWPQFLPNLANINVLCVWGRNDIYGDGKKPSPDGGIAGLNQKICVLAAEARLQVVCHEDPERGHGDVVPPNDLLSDLLSYRRQHYPHRIEHTFRHINQAQLYWLEGHVWRGSQWGKKLPKIRLRGDEKIHNPADVREALLRTYRTSFGKLQGTVKGQIIDVRPRKTPELTIWVGDGMLDWNQPVTIKVSGREVFQETLVPDLFLCLTQAARTYDFERLRWFGLRYKSGSKVRVVTGSTPFPP